MPVITRKRSTVVCGMINVRQIKMRTLLAFFLLSSLGFAVEDTLMKPLRLREVSLRNVPLREGERIAAIEVEVAGARFRSVHIPDDWGVDVGAPSADISILKGVAQHGTAMLFTTVEFQRFLTLAFYDYGEFNRPFAIRVKLVLYLYDKKKNENERELSLASDCIVLDEPNQTSQLSPRSG